MLLNFSNKKTGFKNGLLYRRNNWKQPKKSFKKASNKPNKSYSGQALAAKFQAIIKKIPIKKAAKSSPKW
jgi:uncharacterized protein HemY